MAFGKLIEKDNTGVSSTYWKLHDIFISRSDGTIRATFFGYVNKAGRDAGKKHLDRKETVVPYTDPFEVSGTDVVADVYILAAAHKDWDGAEAV